MSGTGWTASIRKGRPRRSESGPQGGLGAVGNTEVQRLLTHDDGAYAAWRRGEVNPAAVTMALDYRGLYGPQVDHACGVQEPAVDQWEAAALYPSWEQLQALAVLTEFRVRFFVQPVPPQGAGFVCVRGGRGKGCHPLPGHGGSAVFDMAVVAQCPGTDAYGGGDSAPAPTAVSKLSVRPVVDGGGGGPRPLSPGGW